MPKIASKIKSEPPIKKWARLKNITPDELAAESGLGYSTIIKWFSGTRPRRGSRLVFLAAYPDAKL
jgi:transcriptional regulator with XRE-family HTH domain